MLLKDVRLCKTEDEKLALAPFFRCNTAPGVLVTWMRNKKKLYLQYCSNINPGTCCYHKMVFGFTSYEQTLLFGVQRINWTVGSRNEMSCGRSQEAHSGVVDDILDGHFSTPLHYK